MSQIIFNTTIDMQNILGTPSSGFAVAYDLDNVIKQKDSTGVVTPIGGGGGSQSLKQSLVIGNDTGTYSINLGTSSYIKTTIGNGRLYLSYGNTYSTYLMNGNLTTATSSLNLTPEFIVLGKTTNHEFTNLDILSNTASIIVGSSTYSTTIRNTKNKIQFLTNQSGLGTGTNKAIEIGNISDGNDGLVKSYVHINTNGSTTSAGLYNTVIIGGENILATQSNFVYLGNNVNINNKYTFPNVDGAVDQVMRTDGSGNLYWDNSSGSIPGLYEVLGASYGSGTYSIFMGVSQSLRSLNGNSSLTLDYKGFVNNILLTNNFSATQSYLILSEDVLHIGATNGLVTTTNGLGLQYTSDYTTSFVTHSLVTKAYVDSLGNGSYENFKVAYVDSQYGSNATGTLNRIDLPYLTFASASQFLTDIYPSGGLIYIKKGVYTEACELANNTDYFCEPGVVFTQNGFNDGGGIVTSNIYGYSQFNGTDATLVALDVQNSSNINFEFDSINNLQVGFKINSGGNVNVKGRYIKSQADFGSTISIEGSGNFMFDVRDGIIGAYDVIYIKSGFTGTFSLTSPSVVCDSSLNGSGPQVDYGHALNVHETTYGNVTINSNLLNVSTYVGGNNSAAKIGSGNVTVNGNLNGYNEIGLYLTSGQNGNVTINGDIVSYREAIKHLGDKIKLKVNNSSVRTSGLGTSTYSIHINSGSQSGTYLYNTTIYNGLTNSSLIYIQGTTSQFGVYNSFGYSIGTSSGFFIYGTPSFNVGIHNTRSNKDNYLAVNDIFSPSGFIYDDNLYLPNF
jgi:hypothetical protein